MMIPVFAAMEKSRCQPTSDSASTQTSEDRIALSEINRALQLSSVGLQFEFDPEGDEMIAQVLDVESGAVVRQLSSDAVVRISKAIGKLQGILMHQSILKKWSQSRRPVDHRTLA